MVVCEMRDILPGPPDVVWKFVTDWEHLGEWMLELSELRVLSSHREGVGVEAEATIRVGGISTRDRVRITAWEPNRYLKVEHEGWVAGFGEMFLTVTDDAQTYFVWTESLRPPLGPIGTLGLRAYRPILQRTFDRDLQILKSLVRASA